MSFHFPFGLSLLVSYPLSVVTGPSLIHWERLELLSVDFFLSELLLLHLLTGRSSQDRTL